MTKPVAARRSLTVLAATLVVAALTLLTAPSAQAGTLIVTRFDDPAPGGCDPNDCSLREAVIAANAAPGADTINLSAGTYTLSIPGAAEDAAANGDLDVLTDPLAITGAGAGATTIDAGGAVTGEGHFQVLSALTLTGMTVRGATAPASFPDAGSGINVSDGASLTMSDAVVTGNTAPGAACCAGINTGGNTTLSLTNVDVMGNTAPGCCAGITAGGPATVTLQNVRISGNTVPNDCCAGITMTGSLNATNLVVSDNVAEPNCCAGIVANFTGPSKLKDTTLSNNRSIGSCCGALTFTGSLDLANVTITGNRADDEAGAIWAGGTLTLNNTTVTANTANADNTLDGTDDSGGGIYLDGGTVTLRNSILSGNQVGTGGQGPDCFGTIASTGYNLIGNTSGCTFVPSTGDQVGVDPKVGPVGDHGGLVPTVPLLKGSPAVNAGNPAPPGSGGNACEGTDARGLARNCDIGAYELTFCRKVPVNRIGTTGKDSLRGTSGADGILGFGGKDTLRGKGGKDGLCGGPGKDLLKGGAGKDVLDGGPGKDLCVGQAGRDKARSCERTKTIP